ncbi:MAG: TatD family hydrolase, partial [Myxococcota bacterium]
HGYSGSVELLSQFERLGLVPSFGGAVTRERFRRVRAAAARCGRFCIESDTPDHPPEGVSESEPAVLPRLVAAIAEIRGESPDSVRATTVRCAQETFTLPSVQ